jgi:hypothetical protein|tara:strand:+ start:586 stop:894 length:309 start_codon:yes stop_codon:yes gene_type:complete
MVSHDVASSYGAALTAGSGETLTIIGCQIANMHATDACHISAKVVQNGAASESILCHEVNIPINDSFNAILGKCVLEDGDALHLNAEAVSKLEATISYLKQT